MWLPSSQNSGSVIEKIKLQNILFGVKVMSLTVSRLIDTLGFPELYSKMQRCDKVPTIIPISGLTNRPIKRVNAYGTMSISEKKDQAFDDNDIYKWKCFCVP